MRFTFVYNILPIVYYMRYDFSKLFFKELIVSERKQTSDGKELTDTIRKFFTEVKTVKDHKFRILDMEEIGEKKKLYHHHIIIWWESGSVVKPTTFRSQIQKHFGKSNDTYDWKYRAVRTDLVKFLEYIMKDGVIVFNKDFPQEIIDKYIQNYKKPSSQVTDWLQDLRQQVTRCRECIDWDKKFCKRDCATAVYKWYKLKKKRFDFYRMKNDANTLYYWDNETDLVDELLLKM